ncbi:MAG: hypothetical protein C4576_34455 [Desulfobacteraceae bacterium]|nr:MAG: hypothetical protein C4576_34455 [Desulfobacteraceae bacterium]
MDLQQQKAQNQAQNEDDVLNFDLDDISLEDIDQHSGSEPDVIELTDLVARGMPLEVSEEEKDTKKNEIVELKKENRVAEEDADFKLLADDLAGLDLGELTEKETDEHDVADFALELDLSKGEKPESRDAKPSEEPLSGVDLDDILKEEEPIELVSKEPGPEGRELEEVISLEDLDAAPGKTASNEADLFSEDILKEETLSSSISETAEESPRADISEALEKIVSLEDLEEPEKKSFDEEPTVMIARPEANEGIESDDLKDVLSLEDLDEVSEKKRSDEEPTVMIARPGANEGIENDDLKDLLSLEELDEAPDKKPVDQPEFLKELRKDEEPTLVIPRAAELSASGIEESKEPGDVLPLRDEARAAQAPAEVPTGVSEEKIEMIVTRVVQDQLEKTRISEEKMEAIVAKVVQDQVEKAKISEERVEAAVMRAAEESGQKAKISEERLEAVVTKVVGDQVEKAKISEERLEAAVTRAAEEAGERAKISEERLEAVVTRIVQDQIESVKVSEEKLEATVAKVVQDVVEKVARETMASVAERVIGEAIESLKKSLSENP